MHACVAGLQRQYWVLARYPQGPLSPESYHTQPFPIPNLTLPYPQPYLAMGRGKGRAWVG